MQISIFFYLKKFIFIFICEFSLKGISDLFSGEYNKKMFGKKLKLKFLERNLIFATIFDILMPISLQPDGVNLWHLKSIWLCRFHTLKYPRSTTFDCSDIGITKSKSVAQFLFLEFLFQIIKYQIYRFERKRSITFFIQPWAKTVYVPG